MSKEPIYLRCEIDENFNITFYNKQISELTIREKQIFTKDALEVDQALRHVAYCNNKLE